MDKLFKAQNQIHTLAYLITLSIYIRKNMKSQFPGYFKPTEKETTDLWENALFVFDANILLNLYRYSDETRDDFFKILEKIKHRIWLPNQSASEFFENRLSVIYQQEKSYEEAEKSLKTLETEFKNSRQHPFITKKTLKKLSILSKEICEQLNESKNSHNKRINEDDVLDRIEELFNSKVGNEYTKEQLEEIYQEGKVRFLDKIPPGYKDGDKKDDSSQNVRKYGDLVLWKQILDESKKLQKGVILVTDDRKEDWWIRFNGKTLSPRPELKKEFQILTEQKFYMYQSDRFLEFATKHFNEEIHENALQEIRELQRNDERKRYQNILNNQRYLKNQERLDSIFMQKSDLEKQLKIIQHRKKLINDALMKQHDILNSSDPRTFDDNELKSLAYDLHSMESKSEQLANKISSLNHQAHEERKSKNKIKHENGYY